MLESFRSKHLSTHVENSSKEIKEKDKKAEAENKAVNINEQIRSVSNKTWGCTWKLWYCIKDSEFKNNLEVTLNLLFRYGAIKQFAETDDDEEQGSRKKRW